jgi:hypothetical protein
MKIRKQDGLLQRYITRHCKFETTLHGSILAYWHCDGNNLDFVHLLELADLTNSYRSAESSDEIYYAEAKEYFEPTHEFIESFKKDTDDLWEYISGPYCETEGLDDDFLVDEVAEEGLSARAMYREMQSENAEEELEDVEERVARYVDLEKEAEDYSESSLGEGAKQDSRSSSENSEYDDEDSGDDQDIHDVLRDSDEESEDSWMKAKTKELEKTARKRRSKEFHRTTRTSRASLSPAKSKPHPASAAKRKRLSIQDSDDE